MAMDWPGLGQYAVRSLELSRLLNATFCFFSFPPSQVEVGLMWFFFSSVGLFVKVAGKAGSGK